MGLSIDLLIDLCIVLYTYVFVYILEARVVAHAHRVHGLFQKITG